MSQKLGYMYAILSRFMVPGFFIFGTIALMYYNVWTVTVLWFGFAAVSSFILVLFMRKLGEYRKIMKYWRWIIIWLALNTCSIMVSWHVLTLLGPSLFGFLSRSAILVVIALGVIFLKERFIKTELIGGTMIILGVVLITYAQGQYLAWGVVLAIVWALLYGFARLIVKSKLNDIHPMVKVNIRATGVVLIILPVSLIIGTFQFNSSEGLLFATVPAIFSAVLNHYFMFNAYRHLEVSKTALIDGLTPVLVAVAAFVVFREVLTGRQYFGGLLIVVGVIALIYSN